MSEKKACPCCCKKHTARSEEEKKKLINRLKRIEGQIRGIIGMMENDAYCNDILIQSAAVNAAVNAFNKELLASHIRTCVARDIREGRDEVIDELSRELKRRHVNRLRAGECTIEMGFVLSDITTSLERIADHCSNIGVCVTQVHEDLYDTHSHLDTVKNAPGEHFHHELEVARVNYMLP